MNDERIKELWAMLDNPPTAHFPSSMMREVLDALIEEQARVQYRIALYRENLDFWVKIRRRQLSLK